MDHLTPASFSEYRDWYAARFQRSKGHAPSRHTLRNKVQACVTFSRVLGVDSVDSFGVLLADRVALITAVDKLLVDHAYGTVRSMVYALIDFGEYAKAKGLTAHVAIEPKDAPPGNRPPAIVIYTPEEVELLLSAAKGRGVRWWAFLTTLADTGRRAGEVLGLRWEWLNLGEGYFMLPTTKNGKQQFVPLSRRLREDVFTPENIERLKSDTRFDGRHLKSPLEYPFLWEYSGAHGRFVRFCETVGVQNRGFHNFRHTLATNLLADGAPINAVAALLGHANVATTDRIYNHATALAYREYVE